MSPFLRHALSAGALAAALSRPGTAQTVPSSGPADPAAQSAFDFEFGTWDTKLRRLLEPLTGSDRWVECTGLSTVRKVWDGRANLGELELTCPSGRLQGLSLRLFDPASRQWHIRWANAADAELGPPMIGGFDSAGRGEFYNQELFRGKAVFVRFIFSEVTPRSFRLEQAFSEDGGKSWEANWVATFVKRGP
jgi:hypothetical protein